MQIQDNKVQRPFLCNKVERKIKNSFGRFFTAHLPAFGRLEGLHAQAKKSALDKQGAFLMM